MNRTTLVLPERIAEELFGASLRPVETAGVLLARVVREDGGETRILGRELRWVQDSAYKVREADTLSITSDGYVQALAEAELTSTTAIWVHTHPGHNAIPMPSAHDRVVDQQLADLFRIRSGSPFYGYLIVSPRTAGLAFSGQLLMEGLTAQTIDRIWVVGDRLRLYRAFDSPLDQLPPVFNRNVRAFGEAVQQTLSDLSVAIVGCGGTGSAVAEQLVRLGVRRLVLVDPDILSDSNVTRVYGSEPGRVGDPKVEVLADHLRRIATDTHIARVLSKITMKPAAKKLIGSDVVFGCTDDNAGRLVLSRISTYFLTPVFDSGVLITSDAQDGITGIDARVTTLVPGQACLVCRQRIDLSRAAAELLTPEERRRRVDEGYAPALGQLEPAVVSYTTMVAAAAVSELLERLVGYGSEPRPSELLLRCHEREMSTNLAAPRENHYCHQSSGKWGLGVLEPFLEQTWPE